jgi:hypothetical protein
MLHVNRLDGMTIAVGRWNAAQIRFFFEAHGFVLREREKLRTDSILLADLAGPSGVAVA